MAFDKEGFTNWLQHQDLMAAAKHYPTYLELVEDRYHWDIDSLPPAALTAAITQIKADKDALNPATHEAERHILSNWRSGLKKYQLYLNQP
jgi:hypothetical protein